MGHGFRNFLFFPTHVLLTPYLAMLIWNAVTETPLFSRPHILVYGVWNGPTHSIKHGHFPCPVKAISAIASQKRSPNHRSQWDQPGEGANARLTHKHTAYEWCGEKEVYDTLPASRTNGFVVFIIPDGCRPCDDARAKVSVDRAEPGDFWNANGWRHYNGGRIYSGREMRQGHSALRSEAPIA